MSGFKIALIGFLYFFISLASGSKCPEDAISKLVVCYFEGESPITNLNICNCTHLVFTDAIKKGENNSISVIKDTIKNLNVIKEKKKNLTAIFSLELKSDETSMVLKSENKSEQLINSIAEFLEESQFDGVELNFKFSSDDGIAKESYASFVKSLSKALSSHHRRVKRDGYDVFEKLQDDITTAAYTTQTPKNSTSKTQSIKQKSRKIKESNRKIREKKNEDENDADYLTLDDAINTGFSQRKQNNSQDVEGDVFEEKKLLVFVRLSIQPEIIAKKYNLKSLSRYADILIIPTHSIINKDEEHFTYHPSRLMGLSDILNTDSTLDFLIGMGGLKSKMVISLPTTVLKFQLKDEKQNTPRSPTMSKPEVIDQTQLCALFRKNNWTIERDDDLTAPYAFSGKTWLAFEDEISVNIKGKYILLRELAGGAIYPIDFDLQDGSCFNRTGSRGYLTEILHKNFESLERKPRALILESLQDEIHDVAFVNAKAGVQVSEYRIVRVVDHSGAVHVIRKNTKTQFECSRQGYFSHPLGCNKFYRCVKFDQYSNEFTVFEYDCPAGLAFDERWEVCVWPGSLPHGAPCTGSSEIAPVPRSHYQCPNHEGYFADPENCRWFFACLDHARDGITPLTAYEFRCPFGLIFSEEKLACDWPWLVGSCGNRGTASSLNIKVAGQSQETLSATFINEESLEASIGQYDNSNQRSAFTGFGQKFNSAMKVPGSFNEQGYQSAQSAGYGYIASQFDDNRDKASFAAFPDYEISGGRVLNKGGVVLDHNVAGISSGSIRGILEDSENIGIRESANEKIRHFGKDTKYLKQEIVHSGIRTSPQIKYQRLEPVPTTVKTNILQSLGQQISLLSPKPFSVHIPTVQINKEFPEYSTAGSTSPQNLVFASTLQPQNIGDANIQFTTTKYMSAKQHSTPGDFSLSHPALTVTAPAVTTIPEILAFGGVISEKLDATHLKSNVSLNIPSFNATPKTEINRFEQTSLKQNEFSSKINQVSVTAGTPIITQYYGHSSNTREEVSLPVTKSEYTPSDRSVENRQAFVSTQNPIIGFSQYHNILDQSGRKSLEKSDVYVDIPTNIPVVQTQTFKNEEQHSLTGNIGVGQSGIPLVSVTSSAPTDRNNGIETRTYLSAISSRFVQPSIDEAVSNELKFSQPQKTFRISIVNSDTRSEKNSEQINVVSSKIPMVTPKPDLHLFSQAGFNSNGEAEKNQVTISHDVPVVTPQPDLNLSGYYKDYVIQTVPLRPTGVTSTMKNSFHQTGTGEVFKDFSKASFRVPVSTPHSNTNTFIQASNSLQQKDISEAKKSYSTPLMRSEKKHDIQTQQISHGFYKPADSKFSQVDIPEQPAFGHRHLFSSSFKESRNQFGSIQPYETVVSTEKPTFIEKTQVFVPQLEQSKILTEVAVEHQPIVSVGTISSTLIDRTLFTPKTFSQSYSKSSGFNNINITSDFVQPQSFTVATPAPVSALSGTPSKIQKLWSGHSDVNIIEFPQTISLKEQERISMESYSPALQQTVVSLPGEINFDQKSHFKEKPKSLGHVTTSIPTRYNQVINHGKSDFNKTNDYSSSTPQLSAVQYVTAGRNQFLVQEQSKPNINHHQEFIKTKPFTEEKREEFISLKSPAQITTAATVDQSLRPAVVTNSPFKSREQLVGLDITKSIEINPSDFLQSTDDQLSVKPIEIQQQPLQFISLKSLPIKQQTLHLQQEKDVVNIESKNSPKSNYQEHFDFQQQTNFDLPKTKILEEKQYLHPAVTLRPQINSFSTVKTRVEQPVLHFEDAAPLSVFEPFKIPLTEDRETKQPLPPSGFMKNSVKNVLVEQFEKRQPEVSTHNILQPTSTEPFQYTPSINDELPVQTHQNFDLKKINEYGTTPFQSIFIEPEIQSTSKPVVNIFQSSEHLLKYNLTAGGGRYGSEFKYATNPNIEIPEPPREYILAHGDYTTIAPESPAPSRAHQFQSTSTEYFRNKFKSSTYSPPLVSSYKNPEEAILTSIGNLNEGEIRNDNVQQIYEKYSGSFGQVIDDKTQNFETKIINGQEKGENEINRDGSSTARHEVSSITPRPRTRGRLYHGDITSARQAANKYEEYEINGGSDDQRSLEIEKDDSKTIIDLKNLKVDKNKNTVIVVSQVSDANPVLIGKLAGQCSCQSNMLELRAKSKKSKGNPKRKNSSILQHSVITNEYLPPYEGSQSKIEIETLKSGGATTAEPETVVIGDKKFSREGISYTKQNLASLSTTAQPDFVSSTILSSLGPDGVLSITPKTLLTEERMRNKSKQFRGRTRYLSPSLLSEDGSSAPLLSPVPASEIASTFDYSILNKDEPKTQNEINEWRGEEKAKLGAGAAFDRYGPGGWRGFDETLQGSIDCKRPGLFRHPKHCNKFYSCNYDPWKERFTLHVFNCPIHLTYDSSISACNWPVRGPACADDNLLV